MTYPRPYRADFDVETVAKAIDPTALIRNIVSRIEAAELGASVGYLAGLPSDEAIAHELRSLLVDIEGQQGFDTADWYATGHGGGVHRMTTPIDPVRLLDFIDRRIRTGLSPDHVLAEVRRYVELFAEGEPEPPRRDAAEQRVAS